MIEPKTFNEATRIIANEIVTLVCQKQADYGHGNINAFGELGIKVRVSDKKARLKNILMLTLRTVTLASMCLRC